MQVIFDQHYNTLGAELLCPNCDGRFLHHEGVQVFEREEDDDTGLHLMVKNGVFTKDSDLSDNPSPRRHGLFIEFCCENCDARPVLSVIQHKGSTYIDMDVT
ncbi:hypothetical protein [Pseudohongiella sp.]|uniref:Uncharacterized protein n=1 Tax=marine sediment metagenome TaxID=412755 RepID=A0A0F9WHZ7_9ZZZZ|nr:hypothetical protein [Pseudohongiella sp.]HDZ07733.1 hypothetical protein [Pseudohongiella sp.]